MSLRLELFKSYMELQASQSELKKIIEMAEAVSLKQWQRQEAIMSKYWDEIYSEWYKKYVDREMLPISRNTSEEGTWYGLCNRFVIQIVDKSILVADICHEDYWTEILEDGSNGVTGGVTTIFSPTIFSLIRRDAELRLYIVSFVNEIYPLLTKKEAELQDQRLPSD